MARRKAMHLPMHSVKPKVMGLPKVMHLPRRLVKPTVTDWPTVTRLPRPMGRHSVMVSRTGRHLAMRSVKHLGKAKLKEIYLPRRLGRRSETDLQMERQTDLH